MAQPLLVIGLSGREWKEKWAVLFGVDKRWERVGGTCQGIVSLDSLRWSYLCLETTADVVNDSWRKILEWRVSDWIVLKILFSDYPAPVAQLYRRNYSVIGVESWNGNGFTDWWVNSNFEIFRKFFLKKAFVLLRYKRHNPGIPWPYYFCTTANCSPAREKSCEVTDRQKLRN